MKKFVVNLCAENFIINAKSYRPTGDLKKKRKKEKYVLT